MNPSLRPASPRDQEFLFQLYASTRLPEIAALGWNLAQQEAFLRMQFNAQQSWYDTAYAGAEHGIVIVDAKPVGRLLVQHGAEATILVDISLIPEYRGRGLGTILMGNLLNDCRNSGLPVRLQVLKTNPAQRLYERVGFRRTSEDQLYFQMEWRPQAAPANQAG